MFVFIVIVVLFLGGLPLITTARNRNGLNENEKSLRYRRGGFILGATALAVIIFAVAAQFLTELYWFKSLGFSSRYISVFTLRLELLFIGLVIVYAAAYFNLRPAAARAGFRRKKMISAAAPVPLALIFALWLQSNWQTVLFFFNRVGSETAEPVFSRTSSFYLFSLPFYSQVVGSLIMLTSILIAIIFIISVTAFQDSSSDPSSDSNGSSEKQPGKLISHIIALTGILFLFIAAYNILRIPKLLTSKSGLITGVTYIDDKIRIPVLYGSAVLYCIGALFLFITAGRKKLRERFFRLKNGRTGSSIVVSKKSFMIPGFFFGIVIISKLLVPGIISGVVVKPNELAVEKPYIDNHISITRKAYNLGLDHVSQSRFNAGTNISAELLEGNKATLDNVRLWDWRALTSNLQEQQEIRLYYQFEDVDVDRYNLDGGYTQMMIAARELEKSQLEQKSQTWVSEKLKYTHGYGVVMTPAHQYEQQGNPKLVVKNIPAEITEPSLTLTRPQIYFGERTNDHVYVKTGEQEFDYPGEEQSEYTQYAGNAGIELNSWFRKLLFAWRFDGHRLIFSRAITESSRILFRRNIFKRVKKLAPFLVFDGDPYVVLTDEGHLVYMLDAYTVSSEYPYSNPYNGKIENFAGINYIRNPVKVTMDAYTGSVHFYIIDEEDPLINTYRNSFPGLFESFTEMPENLKRHIRYPEEYFSIQARIFATYHMDNTALFYQKEDVWEFSTERYRDNFQDVEPYYVMVDFPGTEGIEFVLMLPYTPKNKNVMNAWIAGRSDIPHYGELTVYTIPKGIELLGPRQIEARIDQDTEISRAMTLWGQRGSEVIRGNLLAIPLFNEDELYILYVEPIYLQAENANLPQIKRIAVADQDRVSWSEDFTAALSQLTGEEVFGRSGTAESSAAAQAAAGTASTGPVISRSAAEELSKLLTDYRDSTSEGNFAAAGEKLEQLEAALGKYLNNGNE